ncbi:MAG: hypothetical protein JRG73_02390 [Deltaproteobacteria bacterium]|nr:hypothetical protein [Deltaproteobacteria bacterium]MBW2305759.1 hypothetical protein [Deltaproteobacteria bacterium]
MSVHVKLSAIIDGMEIQSQESSSYLNKKTGEIVTINDEEFRAAEYDDSLEEHSEWEKEFIEKAREILEDKNEGNYLALPSTFDIDEYSIMERFCLSIEEKRISESLHYAIKGSGAFRRFKDLIHGFGVAEDWYRYRDEALRKIGKDWCEANNIEYTDD